MTKKEKKQRKSYWISLEGGHHCSGISVSPLKMKEIKEELSTTHDVQSRVVGLFSGVKDRIPQEVKDWIEQREQEIQEGKDRSTQKMLDRRMEERKNQYTFLLKIAEMAKETK